LKSKDRKLEAIDKIERSVRIKEESLDCSSDSASSEERLDNDVRLALVLDNIFKKKQ